MSTHENDMTFKVDPGSRTCFFEKARSGQMLEVQYQVIDGHHGDLDISFDITDPNGEKIVSDYKKTKNSIIKDITVDGEYVFCFDNEFSVMNTKTVFVYFLIEKESNEDQEAVVAVVDGDSEHQEVLEWMGYLTNGEPYYVQVDKIANSLTKVLKFVVKSRHLLDLYGVLKSRDSHVAYEDTFIVDVWSGFQITLMLSVGLVQVFMIKKLFTETVQRV